MRLEGTEVPTKVGPISPATILLGKGGIAKCRAILAGSENPQKGT